MIRFVFTHAAMEKSAVPNARVSLWGTSMDGAATVELGRPRRAAVADRAAST